MGTEGFPGWFWGRNGIFGVVWCCDSPGVAVRGSSPLAAFLWECLPSLEQSQGIGAAVAAGEGRDEARDGWEQIPKEFPAPAAAQTKPFLHQDGEHHIPVKPQLNPGRTA